MDLETFAERADLTSQSELERCALIVFYLSREQSSRESEVRQVFCAINDLHLPQPNKTRLERNAAKSNLFVSSKPGYLRLHASTISDYRSTFPELETHSEEVTSGDSVLPQNVYASAPSYIRRLADQINASFENNIFDGCAVLMRRLLEILLVRTYEHLGLQAQIQGQDGTYKMLEVITSNAKTNSSLGLSRTSRKRLEEYRGLGNFAAHRIEYSTRRGDIEKLQLDYRATIEELLHKSGLI